MADFDLVDINAKPFNHKLGKRRLMALTMAVRASKYRYRTGWINPYHGAFIKANSATKCANNCRWGDAAGLNIAGQSDAAIFATLGGLAATLFKALVINHLKRPIQRCLVIADIILQRYCRLIRKGILWNEVEATEVGWIHANLPGCIIHCPLQQIGGFRTSSAPVCIDIHRRRTHAFDIGINSRDIVAAR